MNKKGFTLVEVLAVVVVLAIIMIIAVPNILDSLNSAKNKISDIERSHIVDASETLMLEALSNDISVDDFNDLFYAENCNDIYNKIVGKTVKTTVAKLRSEKLFTLTSGKCSGTVSIKTSTSKVITVTPPASTCDDTNKQKLIEAVKTVFNKFIKNCDNNIDKQHFNALFGIKNASEINGRVVNKTIITTIEKLKEKEYFNDDYNKCNGNVSIKTDSNYKVTVDTSKVTCN